MPSFDMQYDEEDDLLEVHFTVFDERLARSLALNDHILIHTDLSFGSVWGLTFYSFSRLLLVSETEFTALKDLSDKQVESVLALLAKPPASHFLVLTDPAALIARVRAPNLEWLVMEPE